MGEQAFEVSAARLRTALDSNNVDKLQTSDFRVFICETSSYISFLSSTPHNVSDDLLAAISSDRLTNNNLIVAATAYSKTITNLLQDRGKILQFFVDLLKSTDCQEFTIFICHGIFQLNCWNLPCKTGDTLLIEILKIVERYCCQLTSTCYLAFKVLHSLLLKIHELYPNGLGISQENFKTVLDIVLSNWENPLNGVRQQNSLVLNQLLLFHNDYWDHILSRANIQCDDGVESKDSDLIRHQYLLKLSLTELSWTMKSKYFLLTSILQDSNAYQILSKHGGDIIDGLLTSLSIPYLVSAGTDLYLALLAKLSLEDWRCWFLQPFVRVISQEELGLNVGNIFNYWMNQTLKKFPSVFEDLIVECEDSLFSYITLNKLGRKEGFTKWENIDTEKIMRAMRHNSEQIRSQVISLICISSNTTSPPTTQEFEMIRKFLKANINSDNAALRQSLLKSLSSLFLRMRDVLLNMIKIKSDSVSNSEIHSGKMGCFIFLNWLHTFLLFSLDDRCNYQRKITALEIYQIVLTFFGEGNNKNESYRRKSNNRSLSVRNLDDFHKHFKFESDQDEQALFKCLFDEDNNIRMSAANILMSHYRLVESNIEYFKTMFDQGLALCTDSIFYKAESGALITQVLVTLAYQSPSAKFKNMINNGSESFISVLLDSAEKQFAQLEEDILKGASQGAFLYGTMQAIELLMSNTTVPELTLSEDECERLLILVERATTFLINVLALKSDSSSGYAPSFGEMGMAIAAVVESSSVKGLEITGDVDDSTGELQLTPAQQLVLNCVWLNLKECAKLCSVLVSQGLSVAHCQRCVSAVVSVLRRCRHKGAIESAGLALYHITSHLTKSDEPKLVNLPEELLADFLQMLVCTTASTVSRRSAGLAILVHRLITGDSRPKKPSLHMCVSRLLAVAEDTNITEQETLVDLPQSQALHFLRTLVQESSLREHMAQYTLSISLVALTNLASPFWTIRNAALQLFGALVPKLVGQKPNQEQCKGNYHLAFEELYTHARPLVEMMLKELTLAAESGSATSHSKLMPLLTLVTNLTLGLQTVLTEAVMNMIHQFQECFKKLLKSRIFNVRKLSSKALALFTTSSKLVEMIKETALEMINFVDERDCLIQTENEMNGYVLSLTHLFARFEDDKIGMKILLESEKEVYSLLENLSSRLLNGKCSYFTKALVFELKCSVSCKEVVSFLYSNSSNRNRTLGFPHLLNKTLSCAILTLNEREVEEIVDVCLLKNANHDVHYSCLKAVRYHVRSKKTLNTVFCCTLLSFLKDFLLFRKHNSIIEPLVLEVMLSLLEKIKVSDLPSCRIFCPDLLSYCLGVLSSKETLLSVDTIVLPITSALLASQYPVDRDALLKMSSIIRARTEPNCDQDMRLSAAKAVYFLTNLLKMGILKEGECGELIWKAWVNLLQDEVTEVRYEASKCFSVFIDEDVSFVLNPSISLECLFNHSIAAKFMTDDRLVCCLKDKVLLKADNISYKIEILNPFDHGVKSIYAEEKVVSQFAYSCLLSILANDGNLNDQLKKLICELKDELPPEMTWIEGT